MSEVVWKLVDGNRAVEIYGVDPSTGHLTLRKRVKFTKCISVEDARLFVETHYPRLQEEMQLAADSLSKR